MMNRGVCIGVLLCWALFHCPAFADGINGSLDFNYSASNSSSTGQGRTTESSSEYFLQRYRLFFTKSLFPYLRWNAGGTFEKNDSTTKLGGEETKGSVTRMAPTTDLQLRTPFVNAGAGFNRIEEKLSSAGSSATNFRDTYLANLGLRPEGLPQMNITFQRANTYDQDRVTTDRTNDILSLSSRFSPLKGLDLGYQGSMSSSSDQLTNLRIDAESHSGRATYGTQLLKGRVAVSSSYKITQNTTEVVSAGRGNVVLSQEFPTAGLAGIDVPPVTAARDALTVAPDLIDNVTGSGPTDLMHNIGILSGLDTRTRNFGADFGIGNDREINTLYIYVSDAVNISTVADFFTWEVYTGTDSAEPSAVRDWTLRAGSTASYNPFDRRFEIKFPTVKARFFKAVTRPLSPGVPGAGGPSFENIFVTEIQTIISKPVSELPKKNTQVSQTYDLNVRTRLFNVPFIAHDFYYWHAETDKDGTAREVLSNGLSLMHTFNRVFSGGARVAREDSSDSTAKRVAYIYSASLQAVPLRTLSHNLALSSRQEDADGQKSSTWSAFLNNTIELYQGVSLVLSQGMSSGTAASGQVTENTILTYGVNVIPHNTLSMSLNYSDTKTKQSGGGLPANDSAGTRTDFSLAYRPFQVLYLSYSYGLAQSSGMDPSSAQNYGVTWSPFPNGSVQFNIAYTESLQSDTMGSKTTLLSPSLRWNIRRGMSLTVGYIASQSDSSQQTARTESYNMNFTVSF